MAVAAGEVAMRFAALGDDDIDDALYAVVHDIGTWAERHGATRCFLVRWHDDATFSIAAEWSAGHLDPLAIRWGNDRNHELDRLSYWTNQERSGAAGALHRADELPPEAATERALLRDDGADAFLHTLVRRGHRVRGVLAWRFEDGRGDPGPVVDASEDLAAALAVALLRLDDLDDPGVALVERLLVADDETFQEVFNGGAAELGRSVGADWVRVMRNHPDTSSASIIAGWHRTDVQPGPRRPVDPTVRLPLDRFGGSSDDTALSMPLRFDDVTALAHRNDDARFWTGLGVRSLLLVPIQPHGIPVGWVYVTRVRPNPGWTDRDARRVHRFALSLRPLLSRMDSVEERRRELTDRNEQFAATLGLVGELSHQLNTPLHAIAGYAELIDAGHLDAADRDALAHIRASAGELASYVDEILAVSRSGEGTALLHPAVDAAVERLAGAVAARRIQLDTTIAPTATAPLNRARTRQLIRSLLQSLILAAGAGSSIRVAAAEPPLTASEPTLTARLDSTGLVAPDALSFPVVAALLGRDGVVEAERVERHEDGRDSIVVRIRFGVA